MPQYPQHADPLYRRYQTPPGAIAGLMGAGPSLPTSPDDINDPGTPTPPADPNIIMGQDYIPRYQPEDTSAPAPNIPAPPSPPLTPFQRGTHNFGGPATQPGDVAALNLHQTQQDPNIALEGLQQARKSEFEDRATQLLKTGNPADVGPAMAWKGQAERYEGDLANPNTPLNKMRGIDSANTAAQQQGFGVPAGQPLSPSQQMGAFANSLKQQGVNSNLDVEKVRAQGNIDVQNLNIKAAQDRDAATLAAMRANPYAAVSFDKSGASVKPMAPSQMAPSGPAGLADQKAYTAAIQKQRDIRNNPLSGAYLFALSQDKLYKAGIPGGKPLAVSQAEADQDVARYKSMFPSQGGQPAPTVTGVQPGPSGVQSGGVPPELQNLQPGQKATDPSTGETWANRNGQIQRIQ